MAPPANPTGLASGARARIPDRLTELFRSPVGCRPPHPPGKNTCSRRSIPLPSMAPVAIGEIGSTAGSSIRATSGRFTVDRLRARAAGEQRRFSRQLRPRRRSQSPDYRRSTASMSFRSLLDALRGARLPAARISSARGTAAPAESAKSFVVSDPRRIFLSQRRGGAFLEPRSSVSRALRRAPLGPTARLNRRASRAAPAAVGEIPTVLLPRRVRARKSPAIYLLLGGHLLRGSASCAASSPLELLADQVEKISSCFSFRVPLTAPAGGDKRSPLRSRNQPHPRLRPHTSERPRH